MPTSMPIDAQFLVDFQKLIGTVSLSTSGFYSNDYRTDFCIIDKPPVCIVTTAPLSFEIKNPNSTQIHLLAIDMGFISFLAGYRGKRPEGILLNQKDFCFVELKLNVTSSSTSIQKDRIDDAIAKFDNFIPDIKHRFLTLLAKDFMDLGFEKYEAYIVLPTNRTPRFSSSVANKQVNFLARHNVALFVTNIKVFS